jgi:hypothetical protein
MTTPQDIIRAWCASCGMAEPSNGDVAALLSLLFPSMSVAESLGEERAPDPSGVRRFLKKLVTDNRKSGAMFPQIADEIEADDKAHQRILKLIDFYHPSGADLPLKLKPTALDYFIDEVEATLCHGCKGTGSNSRSPEVNGVCTDCLGTGIDQSAPGKDCQYSKDVGMWPEHRCAGKCLYAAPVSPAPDLNGEQQ